MRLSEHASVTLLETADIGGTNATTSDVSMKNYGRAMAYVELGTWNGSDDLDECRIEEYDGSSRQEVTTDASGGNYDTDNPVDADGDFVIIEIEGADLDVDDDFDRIRLYVAEGGNSGVDNVTACLMRYEYLYPQAELQGAAVTGEKVYVDPSS